MYLGVRLVGNLIIYLAATWNWPEFTGLRGRRFPGQEEPRTPDIQPRRIKLPPTFASEWRNIGSKNKAFVDLGLPRFGPQKKFPMKRRFPHSFFSDQESRTSSVSTISIQVSASGSTDCEGRTCSVSSDHHTEFSQGTNHLTLTNVDV